jgi:L-iditol 2-dehydrogenase
MKAVRLHGIGDLRTHTEPEPIPEEGSELVKVTAIGICGSDLHWLEDAGIGDAELIEPLILGHESAGVIETGSRRGERVAIDPSIPCGKCAYCLEGNPNFCPHQYFAGHGSQEGTMCERIAWPSRNLFSLPDSLSDEDGAMLEPLGVAIHATRLAKLEPGMRVGVFGCGPIGLLIVQLVRLMNPAQIIVTDKLSHRLDAALELGATNGFPAEKGQEIESVLAETGGEGLDLSFEAACENDAVMTAIEAARPGSHVVLVGIPDDDRTSFRASSARRKGLTIKFCRRMKHTYPRAIQLVKSGKVDVRSIVSHRYPLDQFQQAFEVAAKREGLKVIINP